MSIAIVPIMLCLMPFGWRDDATFKESALIYEVTNFKLDEDTHTYEACEEYMCDTTLDFYYPITQGGEYICE